MANQTSNDDGGISPRAKLGCLAAIVGVIALVLGGSWLISQLSDEPTPCERYAELVARELDNCHSGQNRSRKHLIGVCEEHANPTDACLSAIDALTCDQIKNGVLVAAGPECRK